MIRKQKFPITALLLLFLFEMKCDAQQLIGGIINTYWPVISVDICNNRVSLNAIAVGVNIGDKMLLMQMQGASIDTSDSPAYGTVTNYNDAGHYELLTVSDVTNNIITFQQTITRTYDPAGKVQLILVPQYTDVTIAATLIAQPWDGSTGGVLAFIASGTVTMNANIDVSGLGFRGGVVLHDPFCYGGGTGYDGYRCNAVLMGGASKGEGIAGNLFQNLGRGAPANGGGGGNDSNTGGGGGSNTVSGGSGGTRVNFTPGCNGDNPGIGGYEMIYNGVDNRVFLGGGGGAGDDNSNGATAGGNGGGIIFIRANDFVSNGFAILAKGSDVTTVASSDGAGGGGGGGIVLLEVQALNGVDIHVDGGKGGDANNPSAANDSCFGPGGGGGAGLIWVNPSSQAGNISYSGGVSGQTTGGTCIGSNGALAGASNTAIFTNYSMPESNITFIPLTLQVSNDTTICLGDSALMVTTGTGTGALTYQWSDGSNGDSVFLSPTTNTTYDITITDSRGCSITKTVNVNVKSNSVTATAIPDSIVVGYGPVQLNADTVGNASFQWNPSQWLDDPASDHPVANPLDTVIYCVTATGYNGCKDSACVNVLVVIPEPQILIPNAFTPNNDGVNDTWHIIANDACYSFEVIRVWNRWGMLVYDMSTTGGEWNGTFKGQPQAMETYFYYIKARCSEKPNDEEFFGSVTLIR